MALGLEFAAASLQRLGQFVDAPLEGGELVAGLGLGFITGMGHLAARVDQLVDLLSGEGEGGCEIVADLWAFLVAVDTPTHVLPPVVILPGEAPQVQPTIPPQKLYFLATRQGTQNPLIHGFNVVLAHTVH